MRKGWNVEGPRKHSLDSFPSPRQAWRDDALFLQPVPRPAWDAQAVRHIIGGLVVAVHCCRGSPREIVMQRLSQCIVGGQSYIGQSQIEAGNRTLVHILVLSIPAVHLDDVGFVTIAIGIRGWTTQRLSPIRGESLDMLRMKAMAECMGDDLIGHDPLMPRLRKTAQPFNATRSLEHSLHAPP